MANERDRDQAAKRGGGQPPIPIDTLAAEEHYALEPEDLSDPAKLFEMDHPNIAKVLDAGATDAGRPYFVMELVKGIRITEYCDQNNLTTKASLGENSRPG